MDPVTPPVPERTIENLNRALRETMARDPRVFLLGEDLLDPYGGAFKAARGLSTAFPDRVISTPISESAIVGLANGLALAGQRPIAEMMFADFTFLAFDQIVNFAAKSVSMYGKTQPHPLLVRVPYGGGRGYGATHSQSVHKHFLGVPDLALYELSACHDMAAWLPRILDREAPAMLFEHKLLYPKPADLGDLADGWARIVRPADGAWAVISPDPAAPYQPLILCGGGMAPLALEATRTLLEAEETEARIAVPLRIYPLDLAPIREHLESAPAIVLAEESPPGGTWASEALAAIHALSPALAAKTRTVTAKDSIIPSARHLERAVLPSSDDILAALLD